MELTRIDFRVEGGLAHLRLNRPEARNAISIWRSPKRPWPSLSE